MKEQKNNLQRPDQPWQETMEQPWKEPVDKPWKDPVQRNHVGYQLKVMDHMFCKQMVRMYREEKYEGITMLCDWILEYLAFKGEETIYQKDIEKKFHMGKSTIAGSMKVLEQNGLIVRMAVKGDARLKRICLTQEGSEYIRRMEQKRQVLEQRVTEGISAQELEAFFATLKKMQDNLKDR